jgi:hypothetical protein
MIEDDLSQIEESVTKCTYRLGVGFERCEKSAPKFVPSSSYHKEDEALKPIKAHYPSNLKSSFNPKREAMKETPKPREETFIYMFCGRAGHLDEFCFRQKRIERRHVEYARDSYHDEFIDFSPRSYSHVLSCFYSRASPRTFSRALPHTSSSVTGLLSSSESVPIFFPAHTRRIPRSQTKAGPVFPTASICATEDLVCAPRFTRCEFLVGSSASWSHSFVFLLAL